ncbi:MAG: hypothetical protein IH933_02255 [Euryarchaeota archaeon]|nr:hypothetical protein [Euryarchaeota archaeon]
MALIEITVDHPSLISTGEDEQRPTDDEGGVLSDDDGQSHESTESTDGVDDTMKNVSTMLTAATTIAGVIKQLREDENEQSADGNDGLFSDADEETDTGEDEAQSFVDSVIGDEESDAAAEEVEEVEESDEEAVDETAEADEGSSGLGLKVAFVLVIVLIAVTLWARGDDETADDDWD